MDISSIGSSSAMPPEVEAKYAVKCIQMARESEHVVGNLIEDTAEISHEAMAKYVAEMKAHK